MTRTFILALVACSPTVRVPPEGPAPTTGLAWPADATLVDLTHTFDETTLYWPTSPSTFQQETLFEGQT